MKIITALLMIVSASIAQAQVYKCPGKIEGQYVYQQRPCKGAKADEHTVKIVPADEKKIAEAQAKLAKELDVDKDKEKKESAAETNKELTNQPPPVNPQPAAGIANTNTGVNSNAGTANTNPATPNPAVAPNPNAIRPAPGAVNPMPY